jgi:uncharacterized protein (TIGR02678 family)
VPYEHDPHADSELQDCACHLVQYPLTVKEDDPDMFRLIRRHEAELDRRFTQRLGYRLQVSADTARLYKDGFVPERRPLLTPKTKRPLNPREYVLLALVLGATVAGPGVISLRDLVERVRSAAVEAGITYEDSGSTRRALVTALEWMISMGLASVLHERIEAFAGDATADAVLKLRPDRIALLPLPQLAGAHEPAALLDRSRARASTRQWMRCRLLEEPVLYRSDLTEAEWSELRRRFREEQRLLEEMFGLTTEARAEGVATVDPQGRLTPIRFPSGASTVSHAALLLIEKLDAAPAQSLRWGAVVDALRELAEVHIRRWSADYRAAPELLGREAADLLLDLRLAEWVLGQDATEGEEAPADSESDNRTLRLLPAAGRFLPPVSPVSDGVEQAELW